jgi:hypothetical protein
MARRVTGQAVMFGKGKLVVFSNRLVMDLK